MLISYPKISIGLATDFEAGMINEALRPEISTYTFAGHPNKIPFRSNLF